MLSAAAAAAAGCEVTVGAAVANENGLLPLPRLIPPPKLKPLELPRDEDELVLAPNANGAAGVALASVVAVAPNNGLVAPPPGAPL